MARPLPRPLRKECKGKQQEIIKWTVVHTYDKVTYILCINDLPRKIFLTGVNSTQGVYKKDGEDS